MKKLFFLMVACLVATTASAQFVNSGSGNAKSSASSGNFFGQMSTDDYNRFYVSYNPTAMKWEKDQRDNEEIMPLTKGLSVGYLHASSLSSQMPLFLEYGANFQYSFGKFEDSEDEYSCTRKTNIYSVNIPLNLALKLQFNECALTPYLGINFRVNVAGNMKYNEEDEYYDYYDDEYYTESYELTYNLFDKSEPKDDDYEDGATVGLGCNAAKRFQAGINFGVGFSYKSLYLGVGHTSDFSKIANCSKCDYVGKLGVTTLTVGINF
ncbi:MAG: hypothetical protein IKV33_05270 [Alistipes sp.]|nr:hypothetical protein [Alistipes sp.]